MTFSFIGVLVICGVLLFRQTVHDQLKQRIVQELNRRLAAIGYHAELRSAYWIEGKGLQLDKLMVRDTSRSDAVVLHIDSAFVASEFKLVNALSQTPVVNAVTVDGLELSLWENPSGRWNLDELISTLCEEQPQQMSCPVKVRNGRIRIDGRSIGLPESTFLDEINFDLNPAKANQRGTVAGYFSAPLIQRIQFLVQLDRDREQWQAEISVNDVAVSGELNGLIPEALQEHVSILQSVRGRVGFSCVAHGPLDFSDMPRFQVDARVQRFEWLDRDAPYRVQNGSFDFTANNEGFVVSQATADVGAGSVQFEYRQTGWGVPSYRRISGSARNIKMTDRILPWLPPEKQRAWMNYQPTGFLDFPKFEVTEVDGQVARDIAIKVRDASFAHYRFPYRIGNCQGEIFWINERVTANLQAYENKQLIVIESDVRHPGENWTGWATMRCDGNIPISEKLMRAMEVKPARAAMIRRYHPNGYIAVRGRTERYDPTKEAATRYTIFLRQASIRYDGFDYPFYNVGGEIDVTNQTVQFRNIKGYNNNGQVECNGRWNPVTGLNLRFIAQTILLDDELKQALPASARHMWQQLRPQGTIDEVKVNLAYHAGRPDRKIFDVEGAVFEKDYATSTVSINPVWFPYEIRQLTGRFHWNDGELTLKDIKGTHSSTSVNASGRGQFLPDGWWVKFDEIMARNIAMDESLLGALPESLSRALRTSNFQGQLNMHGELGFSGQTPSSLHASDRRNGSSYVSLDPGQSSPVQMNWDLNFAFGAARFNAGLPFTNANGTVNLVGQGNQHQMDCQGNVALDSVMCRGIQLTGVRGPLSINNELISFGAYVNTSEAPRSLVGRAFAGQFQCDCQIRNTPTQPFRLQASINEADLHAIALETAMQHHNLSGKMHASVQLGGELSNRHSITGTGGLVVRNAKIYELPVMVALLKVLSVQVPDRTAFDEGSVDFTIRGENVDMHRIEMNGDAISLIGRGFVNRSGDVDMDFYSVMGRGKLFIPVITQLYRASSQQILWIKVSGTVNDPQTTKEVLPEINDTLKRLFGDPANIQR